VLTSKGNPYHLDLWMRDNEVVKSDLAGSADTIFSPRFFAPRPLQLSDRISKLGRRITEACAFAHPYCWPIQKLFREDLYHVFNCRE
jgi:hypothetical protein